MKLIKDNLEFSEHDNRMKQSILQYIELYPSDDIKTAWEECFKKCNFQDHIMGLSGSHVWVTRKEDMKRILMIVDEN